MDVSAPASAPAPSASSASSASASTPAASSSASESKASHSSPSTEPSSGAASMPKDEARSAEQTAAEKELQKEIRKLKLKINGRERELPEDEVIRKAQLYSSAEEKFQEAAKKEKMLQAAIEALRERPFEVLRELGVDLRRHSEDYLTEEVRRELMDPVERELEELRKYKQQVEEQRRQQEEALKTQAQKQQEMRIRQKWAQEYDRQISEILHKADLPKTPMTVRRVVEHLARAHANGYDLDVQTAVDFVREDYMSDITALFSSLDGEALLKVLGNEIAKKIRKHDLAQIKAKLNKDSLAATAEKQLTPRTPKKPEQKLMRPDEWREHLWAKANIT